MPFWLCCVSSSSWQYHTDSLWSLCLVSLVVLIPSLSCWCISHWVLQLKLELEIDKNVDVMWQELGWGSIVTRAHGLSVTNISLWRFSQPGLIYCNQLGNWWRWVLLLKQCKIVAETVAGLTHFYLLLWEIKRREKKSNGNGTFNFQITGRNYII